MALTIRVVLSGRQRSDLGAVDEIVFVKDAPPSSGRRPICNDVPVSRRFADLLLARGQPISPKPMRPNY